MSMFADAESAAYADWQTLLDRAPASWHESINDSITRSKLIEALQAAVLLSKYEEGDKSYRVFRFQVDEQQREAYPISFLVPRGSATLHVTENGQIYEAERDENACSTYPHSKRRLRRPLVSDIAHELGHAIAATNAGWMVSKLSFIVDPSQSPPIATGVSRTDVTYDNNPEKMLLVSAAGVVAECQFDGKGIELFNDPMRVFENYEDSQSDLLKAVAAYGDDFSVALFIEGVQKAVELLKPFADVIRSVATDRAERASDEGALRLTIVWDEEIRRALGL